MKKFIGLCIVILILGFAIPVISSQSLNDLPMSVKETALHLMENPLEKPFVLGYKIINNVEREDYGYHVEVITWFGLTYADIYIGDNYGGYIERKLIFKKKS